MKSLLLILTGILLLLVIACRSKSKYSNSVTKTENSKISEDTIWHLKNRIPNCDSALVFMKQIIKPLKSEALSNSLLPRERQVTVIIPGERRDMLNSEKYKFYINPDCLIGKPSKAALEIFCIPDSIESFLALDKAFQTENLSWYLSASGFGNYLGIRFEKGVIVSAKFNKINSSH